MPYARCCVQGCRSRRGRSHTSSILFHRFPVGNKHCDTIPNHSGRKKVDKQKAWFEAMGISPENMDSFVCGRRLFVCSRHFSGDDYILTGNLKT